MSELKVHVEIPGGRVPAKLSTDHSSSSFGQPVLVVSGSEAGPSFTRSADVGFGPGDVSPWGIAGELRLIAADPDADDTLLTRWNRLQRYVVRPAGGVAWGRAATIEKARQLAWDARVRGLGRIVIYDEVAGEVVR